MKKSVGLMHRSKFFYVHSIISMYTETEVIIIILERWMTQKMLWPLILSSNGFAIAF